jgi:hypothetical protein
MNLDKISHKLGEKNLREIFSVQDKKGKWGDGCTDFNRIFTDGAAKIL